jgi:hypothetical protein
MTEERAKWDEKHGHKVTMNRDEKGCMSDADDGIEMGG